MKNIISIIMSGQTAEGEHFHARYEPNQWQGIRQSLQVVNCPILYAQIEVWRISKYSIPEKKQKDIRLKSFINN